MDLQLRMVQAAVEAQLFGERRHPVQVGRYTVLDAIGSGGMGSVVRAHDPELQREVALKLLKAERMGDANTRARLVQEARAMARLSHPNVAMVFEVGEADGHLFVAMELVDGRDLRAWLDLRSRSWREVLPLFEQAGRGLAAAHAKGLIHRDFKPDNVVVDSEGRARVVDFGLAREQGAAALPTEDEREPLEGGLEERLGSSAGELTTTGTLLGTPAYMSPEQWNGEAVDGRSDQFSFCVSLWEALFGARPFPQTELSALMLAVTSGHIAEPGAAKVPGRIVRALRRGLRPDPQERFGDMEALLDALGPPRRTGWIVGGSAVVIAGLAAGVLARGPSPEEACRGERERLRGVWDEEARAAAREGIETTGLPYADPVRRTATGRLDAYAEDWATAAEASCVGGLARSDAAEARRARQQRCLSEALGALDEQAEELARADEATVIDAPHAATRLPDLGACADDRRLVQWADDDAAETVASARASLALARASLARLDLRDGGARYLDELDRALAAADEAHALASEAGHAPLRAEAALARGRVLLKRGDKDRAEQALTEAIEQAEAGGDALTRARASILQVYVLGTDRDRTAEATSLGDQVLAQLEGLGERPLLRARLSSNLATAVARAREPDHARALALHREALDLLVEQLGEDHPHVTSARLNLGRALVYADEPEEAERVLRDALAHAEAVWGPDHPHLARVWGTLGTALSAQRRVDEAERALRRSLEGRERSLGPDHQEVASARFNLASALRRASRHAEALVELRKGLEIRRRRGEERADLIPWLFMIGDCELARGEHAAAVRALREALALAETDGASPSDFAKVRFRLAMALAPSDPVQARIVAEAARDAYRAQGHPTHAERVDAFLAKLTEPDAN